MKVLLPATWSPRPRHARAGAHPENPSGPGPRPYPALSAAFRIHARNEQIVVRKEFSATPALQQPTVKSFRLNRFHVPPAICCDALVLARLLHTWGVRSHVQHCREHILHEEACCIGAMADDLQLLWQVLLAGSCSSSSPMRKPRATPRARRRALAFAWSVASAAFSLVRFGQTQVWQPNQNWP